VVESFHHAVADGFGLANGHRAITGIDVPTRFSSHGSDEFADVAASRPSTNANRVKSNSPDRRYWLNFVGMGRDKCVEVTKAVLGLISCRLMLSNTVRSTVILISQRYSR
jgi:hypothetical protein